MTPVSRVRRPPPGRLLLLICVCLCDTAGVGWRVYVRVGAVQLMA